MREAELDLIPGPIHLTPLKDLQSVIWQMMVTIFFTARGTFCYLLLSYEMGTERCSEVRVYGVYLLVVFLQPSEHVNFFRTTDIGFSPESWIDLSHGRFIHIKPLATRLWLRIVSQQLSPEKRLLRLCYPYFS